jgi:hypothetical protein
LISRSQSGAEWKSNSYPPLSALRNWIVDRWILNHSQWFAPRLNSYPGDDAE